jgi:hypothetical protein
LTLNCDEPPSNFAFNFNVQLYILAGKEFEQTSFDVTGGPSEAWRVLAMALR